MHVNKKCVEPEVEHLLRAHEILAVIEFDFDIVVDKQISIFELEIRVGGLLYEFLVFVISPMVIKHLFFAEHFEVWIDAAAPDAGRRDHPYLVDL